MLPNAQPRPRPRVFDRRDEARERLNAAREVHALVDARDGRACRCCGKRDGLHKHHIEFRSRGGGETTENLVTLCKWCHALLHARQLWIVGDNADKLLRFEIHEAAVVDLFGTRVLPAHVSIMTASRR